VAGIVLMILRRLPEANNQMHESSGTAVTQKLMEKGLPALNFSKVKVFIVLYTKKVWNFALEAKDLKPQSAVGYRMKKIFGGKLPGTPAQPRNLTIALESKNEDYFLERIKQEPKNLKHYDELGRFYLDKQKFTDAQDIYQYLVNHEPSNPDFFARLAFCFYKSENFEKATENYQKSLALDSTQPNRYYNLGLSQEAAEDDEAAVKSFEQAISLEPSEKYYKSLAEAYERLGNEHKMREALFQAKKIKDQQFAEKKS
jgi:tetratricopeptide (TPR) repeat protein